MFFLHLYRWIIKLIFYPKQFLKLLKTDIGYDLKPKINNKNKFIFVIGLPKSGTTLIEEILYNIGYVDLSTSPLGFSIIEILRITMIFLRKCLIKF